MEKVLFRTCDPEKQEVRQPKEIDWSICMLCQEGSSGGLCNPSKNKNSSVERDGYSVLSELIIGFHELGALPMKISAFLLDEGSGMESTIRKHKACWHKKCYMKFKLTELDRVRKRKEEEQALDAPSTPVKTRRLREPEGPDLCVFCNCPGKRRFPLHQAETLEIDSRVRKGATLLRDAAILKKLAVKSMPSMDARYHNKCLIKFYNRVRQAEQQNEHGNMGEAFRQAEGIALADVVSFMYDKHAEQRDVAPVFKMSHMTAFYKRRIESMGLECTTVHSTRLRERILEMNPEIKAWGRPGKEWKMAFRDDVINAVDKTCRDYDQEGLELAEAARNIRKDIFQQESKHSLRDLLECNAIDTVPKSLYALVSMIVGGSSEVNDDVTSSNRHQAILTISQLLMFNAVKHQPRSSDEPAAPRRKRDTPITSYIAAKIYSETRKKELVDSFSIFGLCASYAHLRTLSTDICNELCSLYEKENVVCPPNLLSGIFVTACVDNIDHNMSSNTSEGAFHGTALSLMQHPTSENMGQLRDAAPSADYMKSNKVSNLPASYASVQPFLIPLKDFSGGDNRLSCTVPAIDDSPHSLERMWLEQTVTNVDLQHWVAFHAPSQRLEQTPKTIMSMLPLFSESSNSPTIMRHAMSVVTKSVDFLNPGQTPVIVGDQPLFALMKQVQYTCPEYGEDKMVVLMGGMHIEQASLRMLGNWLTGSGWAEIVVQADITTSGKAEAALKVTHIKKARRLLEVSCAALFSLQRKAYEEYLESANDMLSFADWRSEMRDQQPLFRYWDTVITIQCNILTLVRSIRESNFYLYIESLVRLAPWFFALNHTHYSRWLCVHLRDMLLLEVNHPDVAAAFKNGAFVARKTSRSFSAMALDQAHEQLNSVLKSEGGMIGLTENATALRRFMVAGPEIARLLQMFEGTIWNRQEDRFHHEQTATYNNKFVKHVHAFIASVESVGNPFCVTTQDVFTLNNHVVMNDNVIRTIMNIEKESQKQFKLFMEERFITCVKKVMDPIPNNKIFTFKTSTNRTSSKIKAQKISLKSDCALFGRLFVACQERDGNLDEFFNHENQDFPPSLCAYGRQRSCTKSDLVKVLSKHCLKNATYDTPQCDAKILDGSLLVHIIKPGDCKTFQEYADAKFIPFVLKELNTVTRLDVVWDVYIEHSLKSGTREKRGKGVRVHASLNATLPKKRLWDAFLRLDQNKTELYALLSKRLTTTRITSKEIYSTLGPSVLCQPPRANVQNFSPCNHEEADTRLLLHAADAGARGSKSVLIRASDTDVVVIAVSVFQELNVTELWVAYGTGKAFRYIPVHEIASTLGPEKVRALPAFHALTGCDTVSSFSGRQKKRCWDAWMAYPEVTESFLAMMLGHIHDALLGIEKYVISLYDKSCSELSVNSARKTLFTKKKRSMENLPPTFNALSLHVKRATHQSLIWAQALSSMQDERDPSLWGWMKTNDGTDGWQPEWRTLPLCSESLQLISCGCLKGCGAKCKCNKNGLKCTALCACNGDCGED